MGIVVSYTPPRLDPAAFVEAAKTAAEVAGAQALLAASQPLVPVEHGDLKASGHVEHGPDGAAVIYSATNPADGYDYAAKQHEDETLNHPNGGQAHYLSDPMRTEGTAILLAMLAEVKL